MEKTFRIGVQADLRVGGAGFGKSETFVVNSDMQRLDGTDFGIEDEGEGHGIEERGGLLVPLVIEEGERVGERSSLAKEIGALGFIELELRGIERHDVERYAGGKKFPGGGDVVEDIPLDDRRRAGTNAGFAVAALDGAAHHDDAL